MFEKISLKEIFTLKKQYQQYLEWHDVRKIVEKTYGPTVTKVELYFENSYDDESYSWRLSEVKCYRNDEKLQRLVNGEDAEDFIRDELYGLIEAKDCYKQFDLNEEPKIIELYKMREDK